MNRKEKDILERQREIASKLNGHNHRNALSQQIMPSLTEKNRPVVHQNKNDENRETFEPEIIDLITPPIESMKNSKRKRKEVETNDNHMTVSSNERFKIHGQPKDRLCSESKLSYDKNQSMNRLEYTDFNPPGNPNYVHVSNSLQIQPLDGLEHTDWKRAPEAEPTFHTSPPTSLKRAPIRKKVGLVMNDNSKYSMVQPFALSSTQSTPTYPTIEFEDFWRNVRNWDFLVDLNNIMCKNKTAKKQVSNSDKSETAPRHDGDSQIPTGLSTIPATFQSARQYKAIYAPHICSESRAQLVSEFAVDAQYWKQCDRQVSGRNLKCSGANPHNSQTWNKNRSGGKSQGPWKVKVSTLKRDIETNTDFITLKIDSIPTEPNIDVGFMPNDMVFLTYSLKAISRAAEGALMESNQTEETQQKNPNNHRNRTENLIGNEAKTSFNAENSRVANSRQPVVRTQDIKSVSDEQCLSHNFPDTFTCSLSTVRREVSVRPTMQCKIHEAVHSIVGHLESSRRTIDNLHVKVSRKVWLNFSTSHATSSSDTTNLFLVRIGSNITALREFTAISRIESMPLLPYILNIRRSKDTTSLAQHEPSQLLASMGGSEALGKGFVTYLERKYNSSQIAAIAAATKEYGDGGFTLIQGPPGTGKTTTLVAVINSLHIRQFNKYFESVRKIAVDDSYITPSAKKLALAMAAKNKPRILVCAPSNAAVDNIILKIMETGFVDGNGSRYNPSIIRVGSGQSTLVQPVSLESKINDYLSSKNDVSALDSEISMHKSELNKIQSEIFRLRRRIDAISNAAPWELAKDWEIRIDENFEDNNKVVFVNHKEKNATYECPPPPEPGERHFPASAMPEYRLFMSRIVKLVEKYSSTLSDLERCNIIQRASECEGKHNMSAMDSIRGELETHILDSVHIVLTTLGTAGSRALEQASKFEVVVIDEAAQSVEPSSLTALQLGSKHCILVGDPQQLPATIFSVSGKSTKFDRSLFQRLEEAGHPFYMLKVQYRMHPKISYFPRNIFYGGSLVDGPNVEHPEYGNPLRRSICTHFDGFEPFTIFDIDSLEERDGTSMSNKMEANFALHLYSSIRNYVHSAFKNGVEFPRVAIITPYAQQVTLLRRVFSERFKEQCEIMVEVNTVDGFQGRENDIVIFSTVRASGCKSIGFLSDVRRMNVALTRAKIFLFVVARCRTISMNPYWNELVEHAVESKSVVRVRPKENGCFPEFRVVKSISR